jgi:hypothetical protein
MPRSATRSSLAPTRFEANESFEAMPTLAALKAPLCNLCGPGQIVNRRGRGLRGATRGVATALEAAPNTPREGFAARREIAGGPAPSSCTPSGRLARGITFPPPRVNRDPPAQAPAETIRPGGRPEEPRRSGANQSDAKIILSRAQQPRPVGTSRSRRESQRELSAPTVAPSSRPARAHYSREGCERTW